MDIGAQIEELQEVESQLYGNKNIALNYQIVWTPLRYQLKRLWKKIWRNQHKKRGPFFFVMWVIWLLVGTMFYANCATSIVADEQCNDEGGGCYGVELGLVKGFYMAINIGYSIGFGFPAEIESNHLYFSSFYVLVGASWVGVALSFFAEKVTSDSESWFSRLQAQKKIEEDIRANNQYGQGWLQAWIYHNRRSLRAVGLWMFILVIMIVLGMIVADYPFVQAQYFAISTLSTGGHWSIPAESETWLYGVVALLTCVGVPLMALAMAQLATGLISQGDIDEAKAAIDAIVTKEELEFLQDLGLENFDGKVDKAEFIILCVVRMGMDPGLIQYITQRFAELNFYTGEALTVAEITQGACKFVNGRVRRSESVQHLTPEEEVVGDQDVVVPDNSFSYMDYFKTLRRQLTSGSQAGNLRRQLTSGSQAGNLRRQLTSGSQAGKPQQDRSPTLQPPISPPQPLKQHSNRYTHKNPSFQRLNSVEEGAAMADESITEQFVGSSAPTDFRRNSINNSNSVGQPHNEQFTKGGNRRVPRKHRISSNGVSIQSSPPSNLEDSNDSHSNDNSSNQSCFAGVKEIKYELKDESSGSLDCSPVPHQCGNGMFTTHPDLLNNSSNMSERKRLSAVPENVAEALDEDDDSDYVSKKNKKHDVHNIRETNNHCEATQIDVFLDEMEEGRSGNFNNDNSKFEKSSDSGENGSKCSEDMEEMQSTTSTSSTSTASVPRLSTIQKVMARLRQESSSTSSSNAMHPSVGPCAHVPGNYRKSYANSSVSSHAQVASSQTTLISPQDTHDPVNIASDRNPQHSRIASRSRLKNSDAAALRADNTSTELVKTHRTHMPKKEYSSYLLRG